MKTGVIAQTGGGLVEEAARPPDRSAGAVRVQLYGKPGCHLCDDAREVIRTVCAELGVGWNEQDISTDPALMRSYGEQIPVAFVDSEQHDFWRVDPQRLRAALTD